MKQKRRHSTVDSQAALSGDSKSLALIAMSVETLPATVPAVFPEISFEDDMKGWAPDPETGKPKRVRKQSKDAEAAEDAEAAADGAKKDAPATAADGAGAGEPVKSNKKGRPKPHAQASEDSAKVNLTGPAADGAAAGAGESVKPKKARKQKVDAECAQGAAKTDLPAPAVHGAMAGADKEGEPVKPKRGRKLMTDTEAPQEDSRTDLPNPAAADGAAAGADEAGKLVKLKKGRKMTMEAEAPQEEAQTGKLVKPKRGMKMTSEAEAPQEEAKTDLPTPAAAEGDLAGADEAGKTVKPRQARKTKGTGAKELSDEEDGYDVVADTLAGTDGAGKPVKPRQARKTTREAEAPQGEVQTDLSTPAADGAGANGDSEPVNVKKAKKTKLKRKSATAPGQTESAKFEAPALSARGGAEAVKMHDGARTSAPPEAKAPGAASLTDLRQDLKSFSSTAAHGSFDHLLQTPGAAGAAESEQLRLHRAQTLQIGMLAAALQSQTAQADLMTILRTLNLGQNFSALAGESAFRTPEPKRGRSTSPHRPSLSKLHRLRSFSRDHQRKKEKASTLTSGAKENAQETTFERDLAAAIRESELAQEVQRFTSLSCDLEAGIRESELAQQGMGLNSFSSGAQRAVGSEASESAAAARVATVARPAEKTSRPAEVAACAPEVSLTEKDSEQAAEAAAVRGTEAAAPAAGLPAAEKILAPAEAAPSVEDASTVPLSALAQLVQDAVAKLLPSGSGSLSTAVAKRGKAPSELGSDRPTSLTHPQEWKKMMRACGTHRQGQFPTMQANAQNKDVSVTFGNGCVHA